MNIVWSLYYRLGLFYQQCQAFENADNIAFASAEKLYLDFIEVGSLYEVNISSAERQRVQVVLEGARGNRAQAVPGDTFEECTCEVLQLIESDTLPRFLRSSSYAQHCEQHASGKAGGIEREGAHARVSWGVRLARRPSKGGGRISYPHERAALTSIHIGHSSRSGAGSSEPG